MYFMITLVKEFHSVIPPTLGAETPLTDQINDFIERNEIQNVIDVKYGLSALVSNNIATVHSTALLIYQKSKGI